ncbi:MAG: aldo/keto reductase [Candidatus Bipolaricaulota bacterium]|nr:aldo/keto reductase [Candidatus Bipolaricaulota bacterium]
MRYRSFGRLDWQPSALGFGTMRLPTIGDDHGRIDEELATRMIRTAVDQGVNYVDTAWPYHNEQSERFLGRCLHDGYRERVHVATKMPSWLVERAEDFDRFLDEQRLRLETETIDFYLLHGLNRGHWPRLRDLGVLDWAKRAQHEGRIGAVGFSFHDNLATFREIVDAYDWGFCQIQYNYVDVEFQAGREGLRYAAERGLGVVVMEPLRGGSLTRPAPREVAALWKSASTKRSQADWALQWVWNDPNVSLLLSGMSAMSHVEENLRSAEHSSVGSLRDDELRLVDRVRDAYHALAPIPCTNCRYCQPCPQGVAIPRVFSFYNDATAYGDLSRLSAQYANDRFMKPENRADRCVACGTCESACPQGIGIMEWLKKAHEALMPQVRPGAGRSS